MLKCRVGLFSKMIRIKRLPNRTFYRYGTQRFYIVKKDDRRSFNGKMATGSTEYIEMFFPDEAKPAEIRTALMRARSQYAANFARQTEADAKEAEMSAYDLGYELTDKAKIRVSSRKERIGHGKR